MALDIQVRNAPLLDLDTGLLVVGVPGGGAKPALPTSLKALDDALDGALTKLVAKEEFTGKRDQMVALGTLGRVKANKVVLLGLGDRRSVGSPEVRVFAAKAARCATAEKERTLAVVLPSGLEGELRAVAEGLELGAYQFTKYFTGDRKPKTKLTNVTVVCAGKVKPAGKAALAIGQKVGDAVNWSRDLSNEPGNVIYPETFAAAAEKVAKENGLKIQVFDFREIRRRGMKLIDAVGRGSARDPRFVHIQWTPKGAKRKMAFIGIRSRSSRCLRATSETSLFVCHLTNATIGSGFGRCERYRSRS